MKVVKVHCGSAYVRGDARKWAYFIASVFEWQQCKNGRWRWVNTGHHTSPRRSMALASADGRALAEEIGASFIVGYGSLHNSTKKEQKYESQAHQG